MRKNKNDSFLTEEIRQEIQSGSQAKDRMFFIDGPTLTRNYENTQLLLRYPPFQEIYNELTISHNLNEASIKKLLSQFNSIELYEEIKEFSEKGKLSWGPRSRILKILDHGRNSRESWLSFRIFGILEHYAYTPLSEFIGFYTGNDGTDPFIEPKNFPPADFPEADFSVNFLYEERAIDLFFRFRNGKTYLGKEKALTETIIVIARSFFEDYKPIPGLDRKLKLLDKYSENSIILATENIDYASGEEIKHSAVAPIFDMLEANPDSAEEDQLIDELAAKEYALVRKIKSEITKIQKERFVKKV